MPDPLLPTRSVPAFASDPRYLEELKARKLREMQVQDPSFRPTPAQMPGSSLPRQAQDPRHDRFAPQPYATPLRRDPAAEGPRMDGMRASELFYDRPVPQLRSARDVSAEGPMLDGMRASELIRQPAASLGRANPSAEGPLLDDMLAAELFKRARMQQDADREREGMVRRMEAQGYAR